MPPVQLSLKGRALRLLSGREHSRTELERKLAKFEEERSKARWINCRPRASSASSG
jgi:SOS response regulatory protein OraA/RecX